jgi:hypothetical protein
LLRGLLLMMQHSLRPRVQYCLLLVPMQHRLLVGGAALFASVAAALFVLVHCCSS